MTWRDLRRAEVSGDDYAPDRANAGSERPAKDAVTVAEKVLAQQAAAATAGRPRRRGRYRY